MGGRLAVGDDDDLAVAAVLPVEDPAGQHQAVLEVRPVLIAVPGQLRQRLRTQLAGVVGEADHRQVVVRELRPDERVQGHRDLLRGDEAAAEEHRPAHVDEEHGGGPRQLLGPEDLEVGG